MAIIKAILIFSFFFFVGKVSKTSAFLSFVPRLLSWLLSAMKLLCSYLFKIVFDISEIFVKKSSFCISFKYWHTTMQMSINADIVIVKAVSIFPPRWQQQKA